MERTIRAQIVDTLHLILRVLLGLHITVVAIASLIFIVLSIVIGFGFASKYGSPLEDPMTWVMIVIAVGAIPSFVAGVRVGIKNKLIDRKPKETFLAIVNVVSIQLAYQNILAIETPHISLLLLLALAYCASAVATITLGKDGNASTSVIS